MGQTNGGNQTQAPAQFRIELIQMPVSNVIVP